MIKLSGEPGQSQMSLPQRSGESDVFVCPDSYEEPAWVGVRWRVKARTFAHLLKVIDGTPQAHARATGTDGPVTVLTFRAPDDDVVAFREIG